MRYFILLLALSPGCAQLPSAHAQGLNLDPWTREDTYRQAAVTALLVVDWGQTRHIAKCTQITASPIDRCYSETGNAKFYIGDNPSVGQVNNFFIASIIVNAAIAYALPARWRSWWQYGSIVYEMNYIHRNYSIGIKVDL
jgi:hypothetical protein